jgi:hypothetical protein
VKKCIVCLKEIEDSASECKYCGSYQVDLDEDFLSDDYDSKIQEEIKNKEEKKTDDKKTEEKKKNDFSDLEKDEPKPYRGKVAKPPKKRSKLIPVIIAVLVVAVLGAGIWLFKSKFFEKRAVAKTVKNYYKAVTEQDGELFQSIACPPEMEKYMESYIAGYQDILGNVSVSEYYKNFFLSDGSKYSDVKIVDYTKYDEDVIKSVEKEFKDYYGLDIDVSKGYSVNTEFTYAPQGESPKQGSNIMRVVKIDGKWYIYI